MHVSELHIYPIKSAAGLTLETMTLDDFGAALDRRWMVVDDRGRFISQREAPEMALVRVIVDDSVLTISAASFPSLAVPRELPAGEVIPVSIWSDLCAALDCGAEAARWFTGYLGRPARLVYMPTGTFRRVDPSYVPESRRVSFTDGFPLLLIGEGSLRDLNARMEIPVPMNRFRPNIVVHGTEPFQEDGWREVRIGDIWFNVVKPCDRCVTTTVDQATAAGGKEPLRTLATYRRGEGGVLFGQNLVHRAQGTLRLGDSVIS
jgi:uncharacterized protein YcbX